MNQTQQISRALLQLRMSSPFFAALLLFARLEARPGSGTAATDGRSIYYDPAFFASLGPDGITAVLLHEVLHCALRHPSRCSYRDPQLWNLAADIVVNGIISEHGQFALPKGAIEDKALERFAVEEVYELLLRQNSPVPASLDLDLLPAAPEEVGKQAYWPAALRHARVVSESLGKLGRGDIAAGLAREEQASDAAQLDWRSLLWRFLVRTPTDFEGYDRRFIGQGLYLDAMDAGALTVNVAIDTSGSIRPSEMSLFLAEVMRILDVYPHVICRLYYADAALYGPYELARGDPPPKPLGGGGTSFRPFFKAIGHFSPGGAAEQPCVYLTDGFGEFPEYPPLQPVLWIVAPGGLADSAFPFGQVVRLRKGMG